MTRDPKPGPPPSGKPYPAPAIVWRNPDPPPKRLPADPCFDGLPEDSDPDGGVYLEGRAPDGRRVRLGPFADAAEAYRLAATLPPCSSPVVVGRKAAAR